MFIGRRSIGWTDEGNKMKQVPKTREDLNLCHQTGLLHHPFLNLPAFPPSSSFLQMSVGDQWIRNWQIAGMTTCNLHNYPLLLGGFSKLFSLEGKSHRVKHPEDVKRWYQSQDVRLKVRVPKKAHVVPNWNEAFPKTFSWRLHSLLMFIDVFC